MGLDGKPSVGGGVNDERSGNSPALGQEDPRLQRPTDVLHHGVAEHHVERGVGEGQPLPIPSEQRRPLVAKRCRGCEVGDRGDVPAAPQQIPFDLVTRVAAASGISAVAFDAHSENSRPGGDQRQDRSQLVVPRAGGNPDDEPTELSFHSRAGGHA